MNSSSKINSLLVNLSLMLGSFLFCFILIEIGLRMTYGNPHVFRNPQVKHIHTNFGYKLEPNQKNAFTLDKAVITNSTGFRDSKEWAIEKQEGTNRILILGDSFTFGNGSDMDKRFSNLIEKYFSDFNKNVEVYNASAGGWNLINYYYYFKEEGKHYNPDILVITFFPNDWAESPPTGVENLPEVVALSEDGRIESRPEWLRWLSYDLIFKIKNSALVMYLRDKIAVIGAEPDFVTRLLIDQVPLDLDENISYSYSKLEEIKKNCDEMSIPMMIAVIPPVHHYWVSDGDPIYIQHFREFAESQGIVFIDLSKGLQQGRKENLYYMYPWDNHLNSLGHRKVADQIIPKIDQLIFLNKKMD
jgi:hypothetical protein